MGGNDRRRELARKRHAWCREILKSDLTASTKVVALGINDIWLNSESADCKVGKQTIASTLDLSEKTVDAATAALAAGGWIRITRRRKSGGRHHANRYEIVLTRETIGGEAESRRASSSKPINKNPEKFAAARGERGKFQGREQGNSFPPEPPDRTIEGADTARRGPDPIRLSATSPEADAWSGWLESQGFPSFVDMDLQRRRTDGTEVLVPTRHPPDGGDEVESASAWRWFNQQLTSIGRSPIVSAVRQRGPHESCASSPAGRHGGASA